MTTEKIAPTKLNLILDRYNNLGLFGFPNPNLAIITVFYKEIAENQSVREWALI
jgi:hypothetical protein